LDQLATNSAINAVNDPVLSGMEDALRRFERARAAYLEDARPRSLHKLRVGLRRMRSALSIISRHGEGDVTRLAAEARRIGGAIGPARQCDVLAARIRQDFPQTAAAVDIERLLALVEDRRARCNAEARALLQSPQIEGFVSEARLFLAHAAPGLPGPRKILDCLLNRALRRGRHFSRLADEERHALRLALKKLRYGALFFQTRFGHKQRYAKFLEQASELQELLGARNDLAEVANFIDALPGAQAADLAGAREAVMARFSRTDEDAERQLVLAWKRFKRQKPFWR
jgi:CHAD domain-containing protein